MPATVTWVRESGRSSDAAIAAVLGVGFDVAVHGPLPSVAYATLIPAVAASIWSTVESNKRPLLVAASVLSAFFVVRASEPLALLNGAAIGALLVVATSAQVPGSLGVTVNSIVASVFALVESALAAPAWTTAPVRARLRTPAHRRPAALRTFVIAGPILVIFAVLLATADRVFASILVPGLPHIHPASLTLHALAFSVGCWGAATLRRSAAEPRLRSGPAELEPLRSRLDFSEWCAVLAGIDLLFSMFVAVQFAFLFGGRARVEVTPGLTYASYARSGFFQLLAVGVLTVLVIVGTWDLGKRTDARHERIYRGLVTAMVGMSFVILASALTRLGLYENAFGFTAARVAASVAIGCIGAVMLVTMALIWTSRRRSLISGILACVLAAVVAFNIVNPDRFVAGRNIARFRSTGKIDVGYLARGLGIDAVPVLVRALPQMRGRDRELLLLALCDHMRALRSTPPWQFNAARSAARSAMSGTSLEMDCVHKPR